MKFINLTFFRKEKGYGTLAGATNKMFWLRSDKIYMLVQYEKSTKITLSGSIEVEVCESIQEIISKIKIK